MLVNAPQRSPEWFAARRGKITASLAPAVLGLCPHRGPLAAWKEITGRHQQPENRAMRWGAANEAKARTDYECETGLLAFETGLWVSDELPWLAASPDGLVGDKGLCEIKCPGTLPDFPPIHHLIQMTVQCYCTGRDWCDYFAWVPDGHLLHRFEPHGVTLAMTAIRDLEAWHKAYILTDTPPPRRKRRAA